MLAVETTTEKKTRRRRAAPVARPTERMRKIVIAKAGSYDRLKLEEAPSLVADAGEVVIDVKAIGVNYADCMVRMGLYESAKEFVGWPITPGFEVAGVVKSLGAGVTDLAVGDRVFAVTLFHGYATEVKVARAYAFRMPATLSFEQAAGFPSVFLTAWFALHELAHPRRGSKILVHSAAGGVGGCLVQLAKRAGCEVTGVVGSSHKVDAVRAHGADHVIDKSTEDLWAEAERLAPEGWDVICDANGVATLKHSYEHLRRAGKLVIYGFHTMIPKTGGKPNWLKLAADYLRTPRFNPLDLTMHSKSLLSFNLSYLYDRTDVLVEAMAELLGWLEDGSIEAPPVTTYALADCAEAHKAIESGQTTGKLVLIAESLSGPG
jgi:NADPH:quinone reductase-like Zn-dependent oxidoreductase